MSYGQHIETVGDLIAALEDYDPETPVRWASQPAWPFEYTIGARWCRPRSTLTCRRRRRGWTR